MILPPIYGLGTDLIWRAEPVQGKSDALPGFQSASLIEIRADLGARTKLSGVTQCRGNVKQGIGRHRMT